MADRSEIKMNKSYALMITLSLSRKHSWRVQARGSIMRRDGKRRRGQRFLLAALEQKMLLTKRARGGGKERVSREASGVCEG